MVLVLLNVNAEYVNIRATNDRTLFFCCCFGDLHEYFM